ncbi:hypothetical protein MKX01_000999 [Papaver californicum]|nr:hypothetical protein MKX01_000999 [Papaver californicum]
MLILNSCSALHTCPKLILLANRQIQFSATISVTLPCSTQTKTSPLVAKAERNDRSKNHEFPIDIEAFDVDDDNDISNDKFPPHPKFMGGSGGNEETDYDRDPEFAEILGDLLDNPDKAQSRTIRSWHIVGRLGGCNSMNMQLSQSPMDKRPTYDAIRGANVSPTTFYNIGDFEIQDNVARIWMDIGTSEPLLLDVLINALSQISSDHIGIKQLVFGGSEFESWKENLTSEAAGFSVHKI